MLNEQYKSLADQFIESGLACLVYQMSNSDLQELKIKDERAYQYAIGELNILQ